MAIEIQYSKIDFGNWFPNNKKKILHIYRFSVTLIVPNLTTTKSPEQARLKSTLSDQNASRKHISAPDMSAHLQEYQHTVRHIKKNKHSNRAVQVRCQRQIVQKPLSFGQRFANTPLQIYARRKHNTLKCVSAGT